MRRWIVTCISLLILIAVVCYTQTAFGQGRDGWTTLFDGTSLDNWNQIGDANWKLVDGIVQADKGSGFLVSKSAYSDFEIRAEFWVDEEANSGVFLRCSDPQKVSSETAYEVNIYDKRPDPSYGTGAIVNVSKLSAFPKAAFHWNTYEITARGTHLTVILNGIRTVDVDNSKHTRGPIALQGSLGVVKFRKVEIKPL